MRFTVKTIGEVLTLAEYLGKQFILKGQLHPYIHVVEKVYETTSGIVIFESKGLCYWKDHCEFIKTEVTK